MKELSPYPPPQEDLLQRHVLLGLDLGHLSVHHLQRWIHQDFQVPARDQDVHQSLESMPGLAPADADLEAELLAGRIAKSGAGEGRQEAARSVRLAAQGDSFAEEVLDQQGGLPVHGQVRVQLRDHALDSDLDRRDIDFL